MVSPLDLWPLLYKINGCDSGVIEITVLDIGVREKASATIFLGPGM